jgi:LPXTG-motif cell wall-anchored protein
LQRRSLTDQVALSTLSVSFEQESKPGSVAPGGFRGGLIAGWNALVDTIEAVVTAAGAAIPWLGIGLVAGVGWWLVRRTRRHREPSDS